MGQNRSRRRRRTPGIVGPAILITIGVLILLANLDLLHVSFLELWRLWPLIFILFGLEVLFGYRSMLGRIVVLVATVVLLGGVIWLLVTVPGALQATGPVAVDQIAEPLDSIERADLTLNFFAGQLTLGELTDSASLLAGTLNLATSTKPQFTSSQSGSQATMKLGYQQGQAFTVFSGGDDWNVLLSPKAGFTLNVEVGAGEAKLDLTGLDIRSLQVSGGASQTTVIFPKTGNFSAQIGSGVGGLTLEFPPEMAARLQIDRGLSALSLPARFTLQGPYYETSDWTTNQNRVEVHLSIGVGALTIREP